MKIRSKLKVIPPLPRSPVLKTGKRGNPACVKGGPSNNPAGRPKGILNASTQLRLAIEKVAKQKGKSLFEHFVQQAYIHPTVLGEAMKKIVANKTEVSFGGDELADLQAKFVSILTEVVGAKDPALLEKVLDRLETVAKDGADRLGEHL